MRIVVLILLLANVALLAYLDYDAQRARDESKALSQQVNPERIRLMTAQEAAALQPSTTACMEIGPLETAALVKAREAMEALQPTPRMTERAAASGGYLQLRDVPAGVRNRAKEIADGFGGAELRLCQAEDEAS